MSSVPLELSREQVLAHRRRAGALDHRLPWSPASRRRAAWAGLSDSMPRGALLSLHARVADVRPDSWEDPAFVQLWGPRFSAYVVAAEDLAVFSLGRLPDDAAGLRRAVTTADRLEAFLAGRRMPFGEAGHGMGVAPNQLRYAAPTGRVLLRWDGARQPVVWTVPPPSMPPEAARLELARRHLHVMGPATADSFSDWAGVKAPRARRIVASLEPELVPVRTPTGDGWILASDEASFREPAARVPGVRLLPSGDAWFLLQGPARTLLVPDPALRTRLWTSRVWPGVLLVDGETCGTWRRAGHVVAVNAWRPLSATERAAVEAEAASFPLPGLERAIEVRWEG